MKNYLLFVFICCLSLNCFSQPKFENGYFINNEGEKTECFIKNLDWKNNPKKFEYKLTLTSESLIVTIDDVKELSILNTHKYNRFKVGIDRSSNNVNHLDKTSAISLNEELLFLKKVVEGKATLYAYEDKDVKRFFYKLDDSDVSQLIFKRYNSPDEGTIIRENNKYKQQLWNNLKCTDISMKVIENVDYNLKDLIRVFVKFNSCNNPEYISSVEIEKKDLINLNIRLGVNNSSLLIKYDDSSAGDVDFGDYMNFRLGIETELIMPFYNNKWAVIIEPTYQYFNSQNNSTGQLVTIDYKSIEFPVGVRYYYLINDNSKIFINGLFVLDFDFNSKIQFENNQNILLDPGNVLEVSRKSNFALGGGYNYNDKYSMEIRYGFNCGVLNEYPYWSSKYNGLSIIFGYRIF